MEAFIFDMDGVIIDSEPLHFEVDIHTMNHFGIEITQKDLERFVGMTNPEMWDIITREYQMRQSVSEIIEYQLALKIEKLRSLDIGPIDGIVNLISELNRFGIPMALASSSPRAFIMAVLQKFGIVGEFARIVSGEEVNKGKPAPDVYLEAAKLLGVRPGNCVVLEDSMHGVAAAKAAGMKCIGFDNPNSGNQDLSKADVIVTSIRDIQVEELLKQGD